MKMRVNLGPYKMGYWSVSTDRLWFLLLGQRDNSVFHLSFAQYAMGNRWNAIFTVGLLSFCYRLHFWFKYTTRDTSND